MKKILIVLMVLLLPTFSWAASSKVVNMTEDTAPASDSLIYTVDDPAGTAVDRKVTLGNLGKGLGEITATTGTFSGSVTITGANALRGSYGAGGITTNFAAGNGALYSNTTGNYNTASGMDALYSNTTGIQNTASGPYALYANTTGNYNTASGMSALRSNGTGFQNTASGLNALRFNGTGNNNTASGANALYANGTGSSNIALGAEAGRYIADGSTGRTTGNNGLYLGYNSKASADGTDNEIVIGQNAIGNGSNTVTLGNTSITKTFLNGHPVSTGADPVLSACGTTPAIVGSDMAGKVTIGTGATTSCTATFATAYDNAPACTIAGDNAAVGYAATTSTTVLTITSSADMASDVISYICIGL